MTIQENIFQIDLLKYTIITNKILQCNSNVPNVQCRILEVVTVHRLQTTRDDFKYNKDYYFKI